MLALGSEFVITGPDGERTVEATEFFHGVFDSAIGPQEMLTEIRVPKLGAWTGWSYLKFTRRAQDWATVGVAALVRRDNGDVDDARITLTNMGPTPLRADAAEEALRSGAEDPVAQIAEGTDPPTDTAASAEFRAHLARVVGRRAIEEAMLR
jgi:carbon-monoxide dehydrogenase medium subunit